MASLTEERFLLRLIQRITKRWQEIIDDDDSDQIVHIKSIMACGDYLEVEHNVKLADLSQGARKKVVDSVNIIYGIIKKDFLNADFEACNR